MDTKIIILVVLVGSTLAALDSAPPVNPGETFPVGDPRRCSSSTNDRMFRFEVIPGGGWDNLRNEEMGMIAGLNYSRCRTTEDGRFLIPDGVYTIPIKSSKVETYAELITHWDNFTSTLSKSVNVHAGLKQANIDISGKFSDEYESVKSRQHYDKSMTTRIQVRYVQYTAKMEPDTAVNDAVRARFRKIAAHLTLNLTDLARYESQLFVRDFGTHIITSIDVGAALVQVDELTATYVKKYDSQKQTILASASASFFGIFDFGSEYSQSTTKTSIDEYRKERTTSRVMTFGGPTFRPKNFSSNSWSESIQNELVALDRSGDPIYYAISDVNLPDVPMSIVYDVYDYVKDAVDLYYEHNMHRGCTDEDSPNFSFQANVNDGSCFATMTNFTFGGVYQVCHASGFTNMCAGLSQKNPQTGGYSCPPGYDAVLLHQGSRSNIISRRECRSCWIFAMCCDSKAYYSQARYTAYWCAATGQVQPNSGFLFGGLYTPTVANVMTQSQDCPPEFYPLKLLGDLTVCVSDDYELGYRYSLPFAGFYSCKAGNPLALKANEHLLKSSGTSSMLTTYMMDSGVESYPHRCPNGYSQHLAAVENSCSINYCVKAGALSAQGLPNVQRPPYMEAPREDIMVVDDNNIVLSTDGELWTNMDEANKVVPEFMAEHGINPMTSAGDTSENTDNVNTSQTNGPSGWGIAAISVTATLVCILVGTVIIVLIRRKLRTSHREADPRSGTTEGRRINPSAARGSGYGLRDDIPTVVTRT